MSEFPGNANRGKGERHPREKIISGEVTMKKRPLGRRFAETFVQGDLHSVREDVFWNIVVPKLKDIVLAGGWEGLQVLLFGQSRAGRPASTGANYRYDRHDPGRALGRESAVRDTSRRARATHDFREILFDSRVEAEEVLDTLEEAIDKYDRASVADLYEMCGYKADYPDEQYGWTDLRTASVRAVRGNKYIIDMPRPVVLS